MKDSVGSKQECTVCKIYSDNSGAGYCSKELLNKMIVSIKRQGGSLTDLYVGSEEAEDINKWVDPDLDEETKKEIFKDLEDNGCGIQVHIVPYGEKVNKSNGTRIIGVDSNSSKSCVGIIDRSL